MILRWICLTIAIAAVATTVYLTWCLHRASSPTDRFVWMDEFGLRPDGSGSSPRYSESASGDRRLQRVKRGDVQQWSIVTRPSESQSGQMILGDYASLVARDSKWRWPSARVDGNAAPSPMSDSYELIYNELDRLGGAESELRVREIGWPWTLCAQYELWQGGILDNDLPSHSGVVISWAGVSATAAVCLFGPASLVGLGLLGNRLVKRPPVP